MLRTYGGFVRTQKVTTRFSEFRFTQDGFVDVLAQLA
jgi:hypothetical protein